MGNGLPTGIGSNTNKGTVTDFTRDKVMDSFYKIVFPKAKFKGSLSAYQEASWSGKNARVVSDDERTVLRMERSVGSAMAKENSGASEYVIGLDYYKNKYLAKSETITSEQARQGYAEYLADKETYGQYMDKTSLQLYEMAGMYGSNPNANDYIEYQSQELKMAERNGWQKLGDALTVNYATMSPEEKKKYLDWEDTKGNRDLGDWASHVTQQVMNSGIANIASSTWMGAKVGGLWGGLAGAGVGVAGLVQEVATGDKNFNKDIQRGFWGGVGQMGSIIGGALMELDYRMGFEGMQQKMQNLNVEDGLTEDNLKQAYENQREYLEDVSPIGLLGDLMFNMGNSISMSGRGRTQALYEGGFQKGWGNWALSYVPATIGQVYGAMLLGKGMGKLGMSLGKVGGVGGTVSKLNPTILKVGKYLTGTASMNYLFSSSEAWSVREELAKSGKYSEEELDNRADEVLFKNIGLQAVTGAMPGQFSKIPKVIGKQNKALTIGLAVVDMIMEGIEEVSQDYISSSAMDEEYKLASNQAVQTFALGMAGGMFGGFGTVIQDASYTRFIERVEGMEAYNKDEKIVKTLNDYHTGQIDSEEASSQLFERFSEWGSRTKVLAQIEFSKGVSDNVVQEIVGGVKTVYNQSKQAIEKMKETKQFQQNDLDLDGLSAKYDNGVYTIELINSENQNQSDYDIMNQVAIDVALDKHSDYAVYDKTNGQIIFTEYPRGWSKTVKEEQARLKGVKKTIENGELKKSAQSKKDVDKLFEVGAISEGTYARLYENTFGETKTGNPVVDKRRKKAKSVRKALDSLNRAKQNPTKENMKALETDIANANKTMFGYETQAEIKKDLVDNEYLDGKDITSYEKIQEDAKALRESFEEAQRVEAGEKIETLAQLTAQLEESTAQYEEKLKEDKKLRKEIKKQNKLKRMDEAVDFGHSVTLEELDMYEEMSKDGEPIKIVPDVTPEIQEVKEERIKEEKVREEREEKVIEEIKEEIKVAEEENKVTDDDVTEEINKQKGIIKKQVERLSNFLNEGVKLEENSEYDDVYDIINHKGQKEIKEALEKAFDVKVEPVKNLKQDEQTSLAIRTKDGSESIGEIYMTYWHGDKRWIPDSIKFYGETLGFTEETQTDKTPNKEEVLAKANKFETLNEAEFDILVEVQQDAINNNKYKSYTKSMIGYIKTEDGYKIKQLGTMIPKREMDIAKKKNPGMEFKILEKQVTESKPEIDNDFPEGEYEFGNLYTQGSVKATKIRETPFTVYFKNVNSNEEIRYNKKTKKVTSPDYYRLRNKPEAQQEVEQEVAHKVEEYPFEVTYTSTWGANATNKLKKVLETSRVILFEDEQGNKVKYNKKRATFPRYKNSYLSKEYIDLSDTAKQEHKKNLNVKKQAINDKLDSMPYKDLDKTVKDYVNYIKQQLRKSFRTLDVDALIEDMDNGVKRKRTKQKWEDNNINTGYYISDYFVDELLGNDYISDKFYLNDFERVIARKHLEDWFEKSTGKEIIKLDGAEFILENSPELLGETMYDDNIKQKELKELESKKTKSVKSIGTTETEAKNSDIRNKSSMNRVDKGIFALISGKTKNFLKNPNAKMILNMLDPMKMSTQKKKEAPKSGLFYGKESSTRRVERINDMILQVMSQELTNTNVLNGQFFDVDGKQLTLTELFNKYMDDPNFEGVIVPMYNPKYYIFNRTRMVKEPDKKSRPEFTENHIQELFQVIEKGDDVQEEVEITQGLIYDDMRDYSKNNRKNWSEEKLKQQSNLIYEVKYISKSDYANAFAELFKKEYQKLVLESLNKVDNSIERNKKRKQNAICD